MAGTNQAVVLTPVDNDPFASADGTFTTPEGTTIPRIRVTPARAVPVDHDPFATAPKRGKSAEDAGWQDYVGGTFGGFNKGLGLPVDLMNALLKAVGAPTSEAPFLGSKWFEKMGTVPPPPDTPAGHVLERIGEEFGGAVLPTGLMTKAASKILPGASTTAPTLIKGLLDPLAAKPAASIGLESLATLGSGTAAGITREAAPNSPVAEQLAQIAGGFTPAAIALAPKTITGRVVVGAAKMGGRIAGSIAEPYAKPDPKTLGERFVSRVANIGAAEQRQKGRDLVADMIGREMTPEAQASLREADRLATEIPGFNPSVAEATGSPGLIAQQKALEAKSTGQELDRLVARRHANEQAVGDYTDNAAPAAPNNPEFVVNTAKGRIDSLRQNITAQQDNVQARRQDLAQSAFPVVDRAERGGVIRTQLQEERAARRQTADDLSARLGLDNVDVSANFTDFARRTEHQFRPTTPFDDTANSPRVLAEIRRVGRPVPSPDGAVNADGSPVMVPRQVTFRDLKGLRERVSDDLIDAAGSANPSRKLVRQLTQLRGEVDGLIEHAGMNSGDPGLAQRYAQFRRAYFDDYIHPFEQGAAYKVRSLDGRGFYKTNDEKVADAFFQAGNTTAADQFNQIFANRPEARAALRSSVIDDMRDTVVKNGVIDPERFATWLQKNRSVLERFPEVAAELRTPAQADMAYIRRQQQLAGRQKSIEDNMLTKAITTYERGGFTPEAVVDRALKDPRKMEQLVGAVRRQDGALPALRRTVWDQAMNGDAAGITKFIVDNGKSLRLLFGAEHIGDIQNIVSARAMLERVPHPTGAAYVPRPLEAAEKIIGQGLPQLSSRLFAFKSGRMQKEYLILDTLLRSMRGRAQFAADDALRAALYDPAIAKDMATSLRYGGKFSTPETAKRLHTRLIDLGLPLLTREDQQAPEGKEHR